MSKNVVALYNKRGTAEQWKIKEGKGAIKWTRLSCRTFNANAVSAASSRACSHDEEGIRVGARTTPGSR